MTFGEFRFVPGDGLWRAGQPVALPPRALCVLTALLSSAGTVVTKQALMDAAWPGTFVTDSSLLEAIGLLRDALGDDRRKPIYIQTVHRRGYRFIGTLASASARESSGELRRDLAVAAFGREGGPEAPQAPYAPYAPQAPYAPYAPQAPYAPYAPQAPEDPWRPIVVASVSYVVATVCVAIVFALFGQGRPNLIGSQIPLAPFAIAHSVEPGLQAGRSGEAIAWTPQGLEIAFAFSKAGPFNLAGPWSQFPTSVSPDGTELVFTDYQPLTGADIWVLNLRTRTRRPLVQTKGDETWARFSPDGRSIAYMSNTSGRWEVYVRPASGSSGPVRVSSNGGTWPWWSDDGTTVHYSGRLHGRPELHVVLDWFSELAAHVRPS